MDELDRASQAGARRRQGRDRGRPGPATGQASAMARPGQGKEGKTKRGRRYKQIKGYLHCLPATFRPVPFDFWEEVINFMNFKSVVYVRPLGISTGVAALESGVPIHVVLTNETHKAWYLKHLGQQVVRVMGQSSSHLFMSDGVAGQL